ncbi:hypothetical protein DV736_g5706, partial [Chaetothyriales sp. CBS 134916]
MQDEASSYSHSSQRASSLPESNSSGLPHRLGSLSLSAKDVEKNRGRIGLHTLNDPTDPCVEIVFVHSLLGDSLWTWTYEKERATFWPEWLIEDMVLSNTRVHTYGYHEPPINGRAPVSKLREIGLSLCSALELNAYVKRSAQNRIIFIAHSLGGAVVKAAIANARETMKLQELSRRFHTILFLATPHRDGNNRAMLLSILQSCNTSSKIDYIDADPNTTVVQDINEHFYSNLQDLGIWSFFEGTSNPVVTRRQAALSKGSLILDVAELTGLDIPQESKVQVNADHAGVVRYQSSSDPTYIYIRNLLHDLSKDIQEELLNPEKVESHMRIIGAYLGVPDAEDEDFSRRDQSKTPQSGEWLLNSPEFESWRDDEDHDQSSAQKGRIYWLTGNPGCGKSYLATHVIRHLQERQCDTSFYYFKHGDRSKQSVSGLLRTIAYQMARASPRLRRALLTMQNENALTAEPNDVRALWKQLFLHRIFRSELERRQYWIIDALDESNSGSGNELVSLLQALPSGYSVFITSRKDQNLERELRRLDMPITSHYIDRPDTLSDIRAYLEHNSDYLHVDDEVQTEMLINQLIEKSKGSFLWTTLIVQELSNYWTDDDIKMVINTVPDGLHDPYSRILRQLSRSVNSELAKSILQWVTCATHPMSVAELRTAIRLDTGRTLRNPAQAIESICSPLVTVTNDRVEVIHDTVREYLLNKNRLRGSEDVEGFTFDKGATQEHLAKICLTFMTEIFRASQRRTGLRNPNETDDEAFLSYASGSFSEHVVKRQVYPTFEMTCPGAPEDMLIRSILDFFQGAVLFWIQRCARLESLSSLTRTGKNLREFAKRRIDRNIQLVPPSQDLREIQDWADDMIRLVTVFGKHLLRDPAAIHTVIPPLCPAHSRLHFEFGRQDVGLQLVGLSRGSWPDRIGSVSFGKDYVITMACSDKRYAVSLRSEQIVLFNTATCQEARKIKTPEAMRCLEFAHSRDWLVTSGRGVFAMYNYETGENIWTTVIADEILALSINAGATTISCVTRGKAVCTFNARTGDTLQSRQLERSKTTGRSPLQVHISDELGLVALVYRNEELELYDFNTLRRPRGKINYSANIDAVAFNPALAMIAIGSFDGELCTYVIATMKKAKSTDTDAAHMAVSGSGTTLGVGTKLGDIHIYDFESLSFLIKIKHEEEDILGLHFASNGLRILDIRRQRLNVWQPAALVRRKEDDDSSHSDGQSTFSTAPSQLVDAFSSTDRVPITALAEFHAGNFIFCGRDDGAVVVYDTLRGRPKQKLFSFGRTPVLFMAWNGVRELLVTADNSSTIKVHHIGMDQERTPTGLKVTWAAQPVFQKSLQHPIRQVLFSRGGELLLVSTTGREYVFPTAGGTAVLVHECNPYASNPSLSSSSLLTGLPQRSQKWALHPRDTCQFLEIQRSSSDAGATHGSSHIISWDKDHPKEPTMFAAAMQWAEQNAYETQYRRAHLAHTVGSAPAQGRARPVQPCFAVYDNNPNSAPFVWPQVSASEGAVKHTFEVFNNILPQIETILGMYRTRLVFANVDGWVCSCRLDEERIDEGVRHHFPLPHYLQTENGDVVGTVTTQGDVVLAVEGDLAIGKQSLFS